jgi:hypothetical protein
MTEHLRLNSNLCLLLLATTASVAQTEHRTAYTGSWQLDLAKSTYESGMEPQSQALRFTDDGKTIVSGVGKKGTQYEWSLPWSDGNEVPVEGRKDTVAIQTIHGSTSDLVLKEAGRTVTTVHSVVSPDGKTLSGTVTNIDEKGNRHRHIEFYERQ